VPSWNNEAAKVGIFLVFLFFTHPLFSPTGQNVEINCPLCAAKVSYWKQLSYSLFTSGLDLKPVGTAVIPDPIPKCKNCGFVFIKEYFTDEQIDMLRSFKIENDFFAANENFPNYYYIASEIELLGGGDYSEIAYFYICSVWKYSAVKAMAEYMKENAVENTAEISFDVDTFKFLMQNAVKKLNAVRFESADYNNMQLVKLDFLRRLGLFDESMILIEDIKNNEELYQGLVIDVIDYQIKLIESKDIDEHYLNELNSN
jgi:hypothetical protein